jgi:hypothetical protein
VRVRAPHAFSASGAKQPLAFGALNALTTSPRRKTRRRPLPTSISTDESQQRTSAEAIIDAYFSTATPESGEEGSDVYRKAEEAVERDEAAGSLRRTEVKKTEVEVEAGDV